MSSAEPKIIYSLPYRTDFHTLKKPSKNGRDTYSITFHPFQETENSTIISFSGEAQIASEEDFLHLESLIAHCNAFSDQGEISQKQYEAKISDAIAFCTRHEIPKIVISRRKFFSSQINPLYSVAAKLRTIYPQAFIYFFVNENQAWFGAFSEVLGQYNKNEQKFTTMALAGTKSIDQNFTPKEIHEQRAVQDEIQQTLLAFSDQIHISETTEMPSGKIKHLLTEFSLPLEEKLYDPLIQKLHPTPAVCGIPKVLCQEEIARLEKADRELYAGYIQIETPQEHISFVNLRCGKIFNNGVLFFAGGGITAQSDPTDEWMETEKKIQSTAAIILGESY